jgi:hypothetical protein
MLNSFIASLKHSAALQHFQHAVISPAAAGPALIWCDHADNLLKKR